MRDGIPAVVRRTNSIHLRLWGGVRQHSIVLPTLRAALLLFAARALLPAERGFLVLLMSYSSPRF